MSDTLAGHLARTLAGSLAGSLAGGWSAVVGHHQRGARVLLRRLLALRQRWRVAPRLRGMAGIDLTGIRHKTGLRVGGWIGGVRSCDEYRTGCRQSRRRGNENAAFYDESPLAGSKNNRQRPAQFPARRNWTRRRRFRSNSSVTCGNRILSPKSKIASSRVATQPRLARDRWGQRSLNAGVRRRGATRAAPFLISSVLFVCFAGAARG